MQSDESLAAAQAVEEKLAAAGLDTVRRSGLSEPVAAAEEATPAAEPVVQDTVVEETTPEPANVTETEQGDPATASVFAKYGDDPQKLAQALAHAQRKLGELGNQLGSTRQENAEYERVLAELDEIKQQMQQPQTPAFVDQATVDWFDQATYENPAQAVEWARQNNNQLLFQRGLSTWKEQDPFGASQYATALQLEEMRNELRAQQSTVPVDDSAQMHGALSSVLSQHPEFNQYANELGTVIERYPHVAAGLKGGMQEKEQAIETLFALAERDTLRALALNGGTPPEPTTTSEVVSATTSQEHPDEAPAPPSPQEAFRAQFRQEAERYSGERAIPGAYVAR